MIHPAFPDSLKQQIGIIAIEMSLCDLLISLVLAEVSGSDPDIARNPKFAEDTRRKAAELRTFEVPHYVVAALDALKPVLADRNLILHGFIHTVGENSHGRIAVRGKHRNQSMTIDDAWIESLKNRIFEINGALFHFLAIKGKVQKMP